MAVDVPGLATVVVFYTCILLIGLWGYRKSKKVEKTCNGSKSEVTIVAGRNISVLVGIFTMTATWVGGGYIMGTAEAVYTPGRGLIWAVGLPAYAMNFLLGGLFFAKPMRSKRYMTMLDPFQQRYGNTFTAALLLPVLLSDILWVACILAALGGTMSIILGLSSATSIIISAVVSISYTLLGGIYSVAYTDIIQLCFVFISLSKPKPRSRCTSSSLKDDWLCVPFVILSPAITESSQAVHFNQSSSGPTSWLGNLELENAGQWTDELLVMGLGGLAYQALYQRILSAASVAQAQFTCFAAAGAVFIMGIPSVVIGVAATAADWNLTNYGLPSPFDRGEAGKILPLVLDHLTPSWLSVLGIAAIAAAVMSSMDSALLSSASMFTQNIYKKTIRKQASETELVWVIRISTLLVGLCGTGAAFGDESVLALWVISADLLYCLVFPQLVGVLYFSCANTYGAMSAFVLGALLRLLSGEQVFDIAPVILYPGWKEEGGVITQYFPYRTFNVICTLLCLFGVSKGTEFIFQHRLLSQSWDVLRVCEKKKEIDSEGIAAPCEDDNGTLHTQL